MQRIRDYEILSSKMRQDTSHSLPAGLRNHHRGGVRKNVGATGVEDWCKPVFSRHDTEDLYRMKPYMYGEGFTKSHP